METALGVALYTLIVMWFAGDDTEIKAQDESVVINKCIIKDESY